MSDRVPGHRLSLEEARTSPCQTCATSPCCTHVPLQTFQIHTLRDLDHAVYLLNFERIVLGLSSAGDWSVYYHHPCRFLDRTNPQNYLCTLHDTAMQPRICVNYNPYSCWYKRALTPLPNPEFLVVDRGRMEIILDRLRFDEARNLVETPDWATLTAEWSRVPLAPPEGAGGPEEDEVFDRWLEETAGGLPPEPARPRAYGDFIDPCTGCGAWCCKTLVFPHGRPSARKNLDYLQFVLGFPGLEVGVSDGDWVIVVRTRCRHLTRDNRCGVFGQPERPSLCRYFDAAGCSYVAQFGTARPRGFLRVRLEQFFWLVESLRFNPDGTLMELPSTERLRNDIEERWRQNVLDAAAETTASKDAAAAPEATSAAPTADLPAR
jgi:Fe-S-cluster containining protein